MSKLAKKDYDRLVRMCEQGLWYGIRVAERTGWTVRVYHDGSAEGILRRFRALFDAEHLQLVRVMLSPGMRKRLHLVPSCDCSSRIIPPWMCL